MARTRGCIWLAAGLVLAALAGLVAFMTLTRTAPQPEAADLAGASGRTQAVVVAAQAVPIRTRLTGEMLAVRQLPIEAVPQGALADPAAVEGKLTTTELFAGEVILSLRLVDPNVVSGDGRLALVVTEDEVLMAFPAEDLMTSAGVLKPGDRVDILVSMDVPTERTAGGEGADEEQATFNLLQGAFIAAVVGGPQPQTGNPADAITGGGATTPGGDLEALLLTVSPQQALVLKYAKDAGGRFDLVLRAPGADQEFPVEPVDIDLLINQFALPIGVGR